MSEFNQVKAKQCFLNINDSDYSFVFLLYKINFLRCFIKWVVHLFTGTCELQRILMKYSNGLRTFKVEECMLRSKYPLLREIIQNEPENVESAIREIMNIKKIESQTFPKFLPTMKKCLEQIYGYNSLLHCVEEVRVVSYDSNNDNHEKMLMKLWKLLRPDEPLESRITKQWGDIGFQGDDPKTDFRGMGLLGLQNLLYFAENHTNHARKVLLNSHHPKYGYSYAIVGINMTSMAYEFLTNGLLRTHLFNTTTRPDIDDFHKVFCYLFFEFDKFWVKSDPENVMAFGRVRDEFKQTVEMLLRHVSKANLSFSESFNENV